MEYCSTVLLRVDSAPLHFTPLHLLLSTLLHFSPQYSTPLARRQRDARQRLVSVVFWCPRNYPDVPKVVQETFVIQDTAFLLHVCFLKKRRKK